MESRPGQTSQAVRCGRIVAVVIALIGLDLPTGCKRDQGRTASIHDAARDGDLPEIRRWLASGIDIDQPDKWGQSALMVAVKHDLGAVKLLIGRGANVNKADSSGSTPLHQAVHACHDAVLPALLGAGANGSAVNEFGDTPLAIAIRQCSEYACEVLIQQGELLNRTDQYGDPLLVSAAIHEKYGLVDELLDAGAAPFQSDGMGACFVNYAIDREDRLILGRLLAGESGLRDPGCVDAPLVYALHTGSRAMVDFLLTHADKLDLNAPSEGQSAICVCTFNEDVELLLTLLGHGANPDGPCSLGGTPLHVAAMLGSVVISQELVRHGAAVNARDEAGFTPLHGAALAKQAQMVTFLIDAKANVNALDDEGRTPLHLAAMAADTETVAILLERGADVNARSRSGDLPIDSATAQGHEAVAELLRNSR